MALGEIKISYLTKKKKGFFRHPENLENTCSTDSAILMNSLRQCGRRKKKRSLELKTWFQRFSVLD